MSSVIPTDGVRSGSRCAALVLAPLFIIPCWVAALYLPTSIVPPGLDSSWQQGLGHALVHHWQAGVDYVFTYGPLGFFAPDTYRGDLFWWKWGWEVVTKLILACVFYGSLSRLRSGSLKWLFLLAFVMVPSDNPDLLYPLLIMSLYLLALGEGKVSVAVALLAPCVCAVLSLVKLTLLVLSVLAMLCLAIQLRRRPGIPGWAALVPPALFLLAYVTLWLALGQAPGNVPRYLSSSFQMVSGYTEGMATRGSPVEVCLALAALLALGATLVTATPFQMLKSGFPATATLVAVCLFFQWKQGFVRQDDAHTVTFFSYALLVAFFFPVAFPQYDWRAVPRVVCLSYAMLFSIAGVLGTYVDNRLGGLDHFVTRPWRHGRNNLAVALKPERARSRLEGLWADARREYDLPKIRSRVGASSVDCITSDQALLLVNDLAWHPRPVFQSYAAFTGALLEANARWFRGGTAPAYLLLNLQPIDGRFPCLEDSGALLEILGRYDSVVAEKDHLLFERRADADSWQPDWKVSRQERIQLGEPLAIHCLPQSLQAVSIDVRPSWRGMLRNLLYKPSLVQLQVQTSAGDTLTYRLIPEMARSRFLLNPFVQNTDDFGKLFGAGPEKTIVSLSVVPDGESWFENEVVVTVEECAFPSRRPSAALMRSIPQELEK